MAPLKMFVAITLDSTLTEYNEALIQWHNNTYKTKYEITDKKHLQDLLQDDVKIRAFESSNALIMEANGYKTTVTTALNELRKYYDFVVITTRSRKTERFTREWIDRHYPGLFEKLHFAYEEEYSEEEHDEEHEEESKKASTSAAATAIATGRHANPRLIKAKKIQEICHDFHIQCIIDKDMEVLKVMDLPYKIYLKDDKMIFAPLDTATITKDLECLGLTSNGKNEAGTATGTTTTTKEEEEETWLKTCNDWSEVNKVLHRMVQDYDLQGDEKIPPLATRLSRYVDDLITVSVKRSINFYTKLILNKFRGQSELRLQANDENIGVLILVVNNVTSKRLMTSPLDDEENKTTSATSGAAGAATLTATAGRAKGIRNLSKREFTPASIQNITTRYMTLDNFYGRHLSRYARSTNDNAGRSTKALPVLKVVLKRTKDYEYFLAHEKEIIA